MAMRGLPGYDVGMDTTTPKSHASHPPTILYVEGGAGPSGYDGHQDAFERVDGRIVFPRLAGDELAAELLLAGWREAGGLVVPAAAEQSWRELCDAEPLLNLGAFVVESRGARNAGCDWKIFMEIYFDDYHVEPFHPGLSSMAECGSLEWIWAPEAQAQRVGASALMGSGSAAYARLFELSLSIFGPARQPPVAAVWAAIYPATMIEWLAGGLAISVAAPTGPGQSLNETIFAYPRGVAQSHPEFVKAHQAAYWETAREDDEIAARIQKGRAALASRGCDERGPACPHLEDGVVAFHDWLARGSWRAGPPREPAEEGAPRSVARPKC